MIVQVRLRCKLRKSIQTPEGVASDAADTHHTASNALPDETSNGQAVEPEFPEGLDDGLEDDHMPSDEPAGNPPASPMNDNSIHSGDLVVLVYALSLGLVTCPFLMAFFVPYIYRIGTTAATTPWLSRLMTFGRMLKKL